MHRNSALFSFGFISILQAISLNVYGEVFNTPPIMGRNKPEPRRYDERYVPVPVRFMINHPTNIMFEDKKWGLIWSTNILDAKMNIGNAFLKCATWNFDGRKWRLPNITDLIQLSYISDNDMSHFNIPPNALFYKTWMIGQGAVFWSASPSYDDTNIFPPPPPERYHAIRYNSPHSMPIDEIATEHAVVCVSGSVNSYN